MKIAILSSASAGGAGIAAFRIYEALSEFTEHDVDFFDISTLGQVDPEVSPNYSATNQRITNTHFTVDYGSDVRQWVIDLLSEYDVLNVQWASYLISLAEIYELARIGKKIVFTLHDFYYLTGGCHYPAGCSGFLNDCIGCPQVDERKCAQKDVVGAKRLKKNIFEFNNVHLSAPSQFIVDNAIAAGIVPRERAHVLRNAYQPICHVENAGQRDKRSILLIADSFDEQRKGLALAVDALKLASEDLVGLTPSIILHLVGGLDETVLERLNGTGIQVITHGHVKEHEKLVRIFMRCQYILSCSYEDNWPNILVEAGSYGCIPIVGRWHGCEEFVAEFSCGYVASNYSPEAFSSVLVRAVGDKIVPTVDTLNEYVLSVRGDHLPVKVSQQYIEIFNVIGNSLDGQDFREVEGLGKCFSSNYIFTIDISGERCVIFPNEDRLRFEVVPSPFGPIQWSTDRFLGLSGKECFEQLLSGESDRSYGLARLKIRSFK
ncbi:glycosyltransferase [Microbulbifer sp. ARAS458-1]|uniref:glycosyltransferase n=1 Tax=Microbulbifer sp. ARAS458-1 TaxID=3140242 RepID=UPI003877E4D1